MRVSSIKSFLLTLSLSVSGVSVQSLVLVVEHKVPRYSRGTVLFENVKGVLSFFAFSSCKSYNRDNFVFHLK